MGAAAVYVFSIGVIAAMSAQDDTSKNYDKGKYYARWIAGLSIVTGAGVLGLLIYRGFFAGRK